jgi:hypothetical protein
MSDRVLVVGCLVFMAGACTRPLSGVERPSDAGSSGGPTPGRDAAPALDTSPAIGPPPDPGCWSNQLPAQVQPRLPQAAVADICAAAAATPATSWTLASGLTEYADGRAFIVGRWASCDKESGFPSVAHTGLEFGANGRWRLLDTDSTGALVPSSAAGSTGYYYLLGIGQINMTGESLSPIESRTVKFAVGLEGLRFEGSTAATYARTQPSPQNGNDNLPSVSDGTCSMVGTWDLPKQGAASAASFSFDAAGNFVGGAFGSDLCAGHTMYGTYQLLPGQFELATSSGLGTCQWSDSATYPAPSFSADCSSVTLTRQYDNCTGGRIYFNQVTTMMRRR